MTRPAVPLCGASQIPPNLGLSSLFLPGPRIYLNDAGTARLIKHKAYWSCLVASIATCLFFPLGTILGVFALMALIEEETKELFGVPRKSAKR